MKYDQMARECAKRLEPFRKTIKDATDFYIRHLNRKKSTGRPKGSGPLARIKPASEEWTDIRKRMPEGEQRAQFRAKVVELLEHAMWETNKTSLFRQQKPQANLELDKLIEQRKAEQAGLTKEQVIDWRDSASRHRAIHRKRNPHGLAKNQAEQNRKQRVLAASVKKQKQTAHAKGEQDLTLTSAGKFTDKMASDIYNDLEKRELPNGLLLVEGWRFENKERVMEAIHDLADRLQFALKRQIRKQARKH